MRVSPMSQEKSVLARWQVATWARRSTEAAAALRSLFRADSPMLPWSRATRRRDCYRLEAEAMGLRGDGGALAADPTKMAGSFFAHRQPHPTGGRKPPPISLVQLKSKFRTCPASLPLIYIEHSLGGYSFIQPSPPRSNSTGIHRQARRGSRDLLRIRQRRQWRSHREWRSLCTVQYTLATTAAPPIITAGGVRNAASQAPAGLPQFRDCTGIHFVIDGNNLGLQGAALAGTAVQVTVNGATLAAPVSAVSATQVTAIMPSDACAQRRDNHGHHQQPDQRARARGGDSGRLRHLHAQQRRHRTGPGDHANGDLHAEDNPAQPGQAITLEGTGLGAIAPRR